VNDPGVVMNALLANPWDPEQVLWRGMSASDGTIYKPPILAYMPIDGYDSPRMWDALTPRVTRIAMTHFGQQAMPEAPVIWHGVDTAVFHPRDKRESKRALGFDPDRFLVLRVDKNSIRKDYPATWKALRPVLRNYADVDVHFHCQPTAWDGFNINAVIFNDEDIRDRVTFTPNLGGFTGLSSDQLATLYSAADLFVSTSWGEGFGLTILEAMACGTPVLAQDCSAVTEVVGPGGILVKPKGRISTPMGQEQCLPDIEKFTYWIDHLHNARQMREKLGEAAAAHAAQFSWDEAATRFDALLTASQQPAAE
jgi:glycosyltransferase involved in cell wall biosynthesis